VTVAGTAGTFDTNLSDLLNMTFIIPYAGAVSLCSGEPCTDASLLGSATANASGAYSFSVATNSMPLDGYVEIPASGSGSAATLLTLSYIGTPYVKDTTVPFTVITPEEAVTLATQAGNACTTGAGLGFVAYKAVDCNGNVLTDSSNVQGSLTQNGAPVGDAPIDIYQTLATELAQLGAQYVAEAAPLEGIFLVCGVPAGETTLSVTYTGSGSDVAFLPVTVLAVGSAATEVVAQPGY
jgi:hypothetical protein